MPKKCKADEHDWVLLYATEHIRTYRCNKCGKDVYEELPHAG